MHQTSIRRAPQGSWRSFKGLIRGSLEMPWELWEVHKVPQATILVADGTGLISGPRAVGKRAERREKRQERRETVALLLSLFTMAMPASVQGVNLDLPLKRRGVGLPAPLYASDSARRRCRLGTWDVPAT